MGEGEGGWTSSGLSTVTNRPRSVDDPVGRGVRVGAAASTDIGASFGTVIELSSEREARRLHEARRAVVADRVLWRASGLGAGWLAFYAAATVATSGNPEGRRFLGSILYLLPVALAVALSAVAARRATGRRRRLWSLLVVSKVLWLPGELVWGGFGHLGRGQAPVPSVPEGFFLAPDGAAPAPARRRL